MPDKLKNSKKGLINIKNNDNKCFLWYHIRHLNPLKTDPLRIIKADRIMVNDLDYEGIQFPGSEKDYCKIQKIDPVHISDKKLKDCMDLLLITDKNKSHYAYIKDFNRCMCNKTKNKNKKHFCRYCLQCLSSEKVLQEHKKICLKINGKQSVKLKSDTIKFKNHFKQLSVPFKVYADFESILKGVKTN